MPYLTVVDHDTQRGHITSGNVDVFCPNTVLRPILDRTICLRVREWKSNLALGLSACTMITMEIGVVSSTG